MAVERADAARNRRAILQATEKLLATHRPEQISMGQVAVAAGVGKGTVFHRFGSRMGLMLALMQERAYALQAAVTDGPPPLGPGAAPRDRLLAFVDGIVEVVGRNKGLLAALGHAASTSQHASGESREAHPVYVFWHDHIAALSVEVRPDLDGDLFAHVILSTVNAEPILALLERGESDRLSSVLRTIITATLHA